MDQHHETNGIRLTEINTGDGDGADITFEFNNKRITVSLFASSSAHDTRDTQHEAPVEDRLIHLLGQAVDSLDDEYEDIIDEVLEALFPVGESLFTQVAPAQRDSQLITRDLHSHL
jgi:hypothetical protein